MHELKLSVKNLVLIICGQKLNTRIGFHFLANALVRYAI